MEQHNHILDKEGEICTECGLFEEFFMVIPDCPAIDDEDEGDIDEAEVEEILS